MAKFQSLFLMGIRGTSLVSKFALTLFIARFMGFETLGLYGLIVSGGFLVPAFFGLGLMYVQGRKAVTQTQEEIVTALYYYGRFLAFIYVVLLCISCVIGIYTGNTLFALVIILAILFEHINNDLYVLLLNLSKPLTANILHFIRTSVWILTFMVIAFLCPSLRTMETLLIAWILGGMSAVIGFFWSTKKWSWRIKLPAFSLKKWVLEEFRTSRTIYVNSMVDATGQYMNYFLITLFLGLELTGVYVYFTQIISAMSNLLRTGIIQQSRPKLIRAYKSKDSSFHTLYKTCLKHTFLTALGMAVIAGPSMYIITFYLVDKPLALDWFPVLWVYLVLFMILIICEVNDLVFYSYYRDDLILKLSLVSVTGLLILNTAFIPQFELWGAVLAPLCVAILKFYLQRSRVKRLLQREVV